MPRSDYEISLDYRQALASEHLFSSSSAPWQQEVLRQELTSLGLPLDAVVLDAASGVGNNIRTLLGHSSSVVAIDRSQKALDFSRKRYADAGSSIVYSKGELEDLPFGDDAFDLILCTEALEHIDDIAKAISELTRVAKPGGALILSFQNYLNVSGIIKPVVEMMTGKNWDAWGSHAHEGGYERHLNYFTVRKAIRKVPGLRIINVRGADYLNGWFNWFPGVRGNYDLLDRTPVFILGRLPILNLLGMDCFISLKKEYDNHK